MLSAMCAKSWHTPVFVFHTVASGVEFSVAPDWYLNSAWIASFMRWSDSPSGALPGRYLLAHCTASRPISTTGVGWR